VWGRGRDNAVGGLYDLVSLEPLLYRRPRRDLLRQLDLPPGDTVLDLGCGNGLNFQTSLLRSGRADASSGSTPARACSPPRSDALRKRAGATSL